MTGMIHGAAGTCCGGFTGVVSPPFVLFLPLKIFPADIKLREAVRGFVARYFSIPSPFRSE